MSENLSKHDSSLDPQLLLKLSKSSVDGFFLSYQRETVANARKLQIYGLL